MKFNYWFVLGWDPKCRGGVTHVVLNLYRQFMQCGFNPTILVSSWEAKQLRQETRDGLKIRFMRFRNPISNSAKGILMYWLTLPLTLLHIARVLCKENVSTVNPHFPDESVLSFVILRKMGLFQGRLILSFHGTDFTNIKSANGYRLVIWRFILNNVDAIVPCSHSLAKRILEKFPGLEASMKVIHNGIARESFDITRNKETNLDIQLTKTEFILNVAKFEHHKGQDVLIKAFSLIANDYPRMTLIMVGTNGSALNKLKDLVGKLMLKKRILFIENLPPDELISYYESAKLFVLPSRAESFGLVVLEAGFFGLPVIASRIDGLPEIIVSPKFGILIKPDDFELLAVSMRHILNNTELASCIGKNLQCYVRSNFTWDKAVDKYLALL